MKFLLLTGLLAAGAAGAETPRSIVVMDGSGSMWGQIGGRTKLEIARETVGQVLADIPADQQIGLMAYGHRRKGDCADIELIVPPEAGTGSAIADRVNTMKFLGKTPLSDAVRQAAAVLRYGEEAATVILVTDGLETCAADPCAVARELEASGLNFTAHVIGFGLSREEGAEVACLAEETGGRYIQARDARSLAEALAQTVSDQPSPPPEALPTTELTAPEIAPIGSKVQVGWTGSSDKLDTIEIAAIGGDAFGYAYVFNENPVTLQMPGTIGDYELRYKSGDQTVIATRPIAVTEAPLSITAPDQAGVGQLVPVFWSGPNADLDTIQLRLPGDDSYLTYDYLTAGNPLVMRMPDQPGDYEFIYKLNDSEVIFTRPITVLPAGAAVPPIPAALTAPEQAEAGSELRIRWQGPGAASDYITLRKQGEADLLDYVLIGQSDQVVLVMPTEPGAYEIGYLFGDEVELATLPITIFAPESDQPVEATPIALPVTLRADTGAAEVMVQWSATPAPGNTLAETYAPEAWAMGEMVMGPVETSFLPGAYDVRGDAGDAVFTGRITVVEGGENSFVIPYDPSQSPAGPDDPPENPAPQDPVPVSITGEYGGMVVDWRATPASGQDADALASGSQPEPWETTLDPGDWLIEGWAEGADGPLYAARITVAPQVPLDLTLLRTTAPDRKPQTIEGVEIVQHCAGEIACYGIAAAGVKLSLLPGWATSAAENYTTAGGVVSDQPTLNIFAGAPLQWAAVLNPRQWDALLGPCVEVSLGQFCAMAEADPLGVALLRHTLTALPPELPEGQPIALPEGVDLRELLAPGLIKE